MMRTIQNVRPQRLLAKRASSPTYFTGRQCKYGHIAPRNTVDASCVECRSVFRAGYRVEAAAYAQGRRDIALAADPEGTRAAWAKWQREERIRNPEKFRIRDRHYSKIKRQKYPERKLAETRMRQAAKLLRTPPWTDAQSIRKFYEQCPPGHEVDHIIPLRGKTVSGLHVVANLQYLTPDANRKKGNHFDGWAMEAESQ